MIPEFPLFKNLELSDRKEIEAVASQFPPYSEYQFPVMWCWEIHQPFQLSILNSNLIIKQTNCLTGDYFFSLVGTNALPQTIKDLAVFFKQHKLPCTLRCVPEETIKCLDGASVRITEDRNNFDYIYNVSDMHLATGQKNKIYRHKFSRFNRNFPTVITRQIDLSDSVAKNQITDVFTTWIKNKSEDQKECEPAIEYRALNKLLSSAHELDSLVALGVFEKNEMIAFSINEINDNNFMNGLFWKANTNYDGIYQFLMKELINLTNSRGLKFINLESDLGIESLRTSKLNLHPSFFLKKYTVEFSEI